MRETPNAVNITSRVRKEGDFWDYDFKSILVGNEDLRRLALEVDILGMALEEIRSERIKKLRELEERGIEGYPASAVRTHRIAEVLKKFPAFAKGRKINTVVGRIMANRGHGGATFADLRDGSGKIQVLFKKDILGAEYDRFSDAADMGDFIEITGKAFKTKKGEPTIEVHKWKMLAKSLLPLPEKWHGLQDVEERFRKRYLDLLVNEGVRERFLIRAKIISTLRALLEKAEFVEVETPLLQPIPGGALAKPFRTHHNALDIDFYLRVAPELYLKRLLIGGIERVYEIGRNFRNEGIDATHNPEFTMLECYAAYWDEKDMMAFVEDSIIDLVKTVVGKKGEVSHDGNAIQFKKPFPRVALKDLLKKYALIPDYDAETRDGLSLRARQLGIDSPPHESKGKIADEIYKKIARPKLIQPVFVVNHPLDISPLAKKRVENPAEVRRFQLIAGGMELANAFSELNDPLDQRARFEEQEDMRDSGGEEAHRIDEDYIEAMEYGMPPAAGLGVGIDRLVMLLTNVQNVREVVLFPTLKPKQ